MRCRLDQVDRLHSAFLALFAIWLDLETFIKSFQRFVILLHHLMASTLTDPALHKLGVQLDSFVCILKGLCWLHKFDEALGSICVYRNICRISTETLIELFYGIWELALFEELTTFTFMFFCNVRVQVCFGLQLFFEFLKTLH